MSDIAAFLEDCEEWREISAHLARGKAPQSLLAILPGPFAENFARRYARQLLCWSGTGKDDCEACRAWAEDGHPDFVVSSEWGTPPGIGNCLVLNGELSLRPVVSRRRLVVIPEADKLSLPAANSLLKLTEEPPEDGYVLFIAERDNLIPTIRSRVWTVRLTPNQDSGDVRAAPPQTASEWADWLEKSKKNAEDIFNEANAWSLWFAGKKDWEMAASLKNVLFLAQKRHLPVSMVQDALFALLREGRKSEQIFGDLREA